ncbi:type IV pilus modification protein PilV [Comamonas jiangduensis]|jgi:type IV pilus assembly protein PilV|uniref:type IV pilus modification protein PilV n=1 Tax=Comamonas jiangduensis TaxID=1194168 RepID=UPI0015829714|nr:type IV pilus modification protein PilV [Comamonas jiangduensis]
MTYPTHSHFPHQRGVTLIESLVAIIIMALGILGILGMQMRTLNNTQTSLYRTQAIRLIEDLSERMATNPNALLNLSNYVSDWDDDVAADKNCSSVTCTNSEIAAYDLEQWKTAVQDNLPTGQANIFLAPGETVNANRRQLGVMIAWRENELAQDDDYKDPINAASGSGQNASCPADHSCHLQYITVIARCAPYFAGTNTQLFCPGS